MVLGNHIVKNALVNFSRETVNTSAPAFHQVAGIRAGYTLMSQPETQAVRSDIPFDLDDCLATKEQNSH